MSRKSTGRSVKKTSSRKKTGQANPSRFLKSVLAAALTSFGIATAWLHPQGLNWQSLEPFLVSLGWPGATQQDSVSVPASVEGYVQTSFAHCPQFFPGSRPVVPMAYTQRELCFSSFAILHSGQTKTPVFVVQRLNRQQIQSAKGLKRTDRFYAEGRLPQAERAELNDYRGSGFSRGHMAPAGDMASEQSMAQSFSLANMVPQNQVHNAGPWNKIEADTRKYVARAAGNVYVFTGPVYERNAATIGSSQVAVPSHLFKLVYDATTGRSWVHWQANQASTRVGPPISYEEFVRRTGLHLLPDTSLKRSG
ncbi:DNA/RNA non-specific endonuclease [Alcaligenes nematophilus]|uniref:DNA/RNA non-specific endonuclease n=2 Tax=Alcaligenes TaxID=507 RepID=A0ABU3MX57_9BURK|nr:MULTISPECIES: DNA/RNA non-specific endonuclease [Alcaligenes]MDT8467020.1 DNA/RNA non-specific endonuclease [Alcaligenes nematophilus]MDT8470323.1 DNA/RNA non-specific endonuclease [Alcaligenes nematophilus]MDT8505446.1 DNA/RNA non-specific endonuclease [Alcaligenes nematophilus]MDT8526069.1 DNA/RNA non-specific endonuclease [Alcaligenes nematophilus]